MINKEQGRIIKLDIGDLIENPSESNENKENSENYNNSNNSNKDFSSINNPEMKLDEEEQNNLKENMKNNQKNNYKKSKNRRSRLTIDPQEETTPQHPKKIYTEEEKLKKANENSYYFNWNLINKRNELNNHFLKRKIEQSYERDDNKLQVFFNVPFFPKEELFMPWQLTQNNNYLYNLNRNAQYNKMGMIQNRNINYPNGMRYVNNNINNNMIKNNNMGNINNMKNYAQNNANVNNINNIPNNIKNQNNLTQTVKNQNNNINQNNKINQSSIINNNNTPYVKPQKPILDTSLLKDSKFISPVNKPDNNIKKNPLFALTTDLPNKKENENNNEIKPKEENNELKEIDINIDNKETDQK